MTARTRGRVAQWTNRSIMSAFRPRVTLDSIQVFGHSHTICWHETHKEPGFLADGDIQVGYSKVCVRRFLCKRHELTSSSWYNSPKWSDLSIRLSSGRSVHVHKMVLCSRNEYFNKLCGLESRFAVSTAERHVPDLAANTSTGERAGRD
jgi:hypothetical protein